MSLSVRKFISLCTSYPNTLMRTLTWSIGGNGAHSFVQWECPLRPSITLIPCQPLAAWEQEVLAFSGHVHADLFNKPATAGGGAIVSKLWKSKNYSQLMVSRLITFNEVLLSPVNSNFISCYSFILGQMIIYSLKKKVKDLSKFNKEKRSSLKQKF